MDPLVSIIIPTHRPALLPLAVRSALAQTYPHTEIIVSDNSGGEDIRAFCAGFPQIRYRRNEDGNWRSNIAGPMELAQGEYVKYLFDDDLLYPHCLETMMGYLLTNTEVPASRVALVFSARHLIDEKGLCWGELRARIDTVSVLPGRDVAKEIIKANTNVVGEFSTVLFARSHLEIQKATDIFEYDGQYFGGVMDVPLYLSLLERGDALYVPYSLSAFRRRRDEETHVLATNPYFHTAVSDWFRLSQSALRRGLVDREEAVVAADGFLRLAAGWLKQFPSELTPFIKQARAFVDSRGQIDIDIPQT